MTETQIEKIKQLISSKYRDHIEIQDRREGRLVLYPDTEINHLKKYKEGDEIFITHLPNLPIPELINFLQTMPESAHVEDDSCIGGGCSIYRKILPEDLDKLNAEAAARYEANEAFEQEVEEYIEEFSKTHEDVLTYHRGVVFKKDLTKSIF